MPTTSPKVLLIGWDAADWKVINPLMDAGKLPNLQYFVENGTIGNIATLQPALSPTLWTSIATGKRPYKHGVHGFSEPDPVSGAIRPVTNLSRKTKAIWNILNQEGKDTITVGWWPSNPAEPLSRGVMVSDDFQQTHGAPMGEGGTCTEETIEKWPLKPGTIHPERLIEKLKPLRFHPAELGEEELRMFLPGLDGMSQEDLDRIAKDPRMQSLMKTIADCTSIQSAATALLANEPWDLACVYYDAIDHFGHGFMKYHPPQRKGVSDEDFRVYQYITEAGYIYHDMMLGALLTIAGEDTTVILMSDHGFHPDDLRLSNIPREPAGPAAEHRQFGILAAMGPGIRKDERIYGANLLDLCPTLLHLFGLPVGEDMDGKVLLDLYGDNPAPVERIPSWDQVEGDHGMHPPDKQIAPEDSKAALDQLVALGYIDEPDADRSKALEQTVRELDYNLAGAYLDGGLYNEAVAILERLYAKWPMEHRFGFKLATCYQSQGRPADLRELVSTVLERRIEEANDAVTELKALKLDDEDAQKAEAEKVEKMTEAEKKKFGQERRELIGKANPNLFTLRYLEATADFAEKKFDDALEKLTQLDSDFGARRQALTLRGDILARLQRWDEAQAAYEEALDIDRETPAPLLGLARIALAQRDYLSAIENARASVGLLFFHPRAHYILGMAHYREGQMDEAESAFLVCIRQAPLFAPAYRMLSEIARWVKHDPGMAYFFKEEAQKARTRLAEIRAQGSAHKDEDAGTARPTSDDRPMPVLESFPEKLADTPAADILTVVSGLPRSGTSLMMQILEAAGIPTYTDDHRPADDSNQKGYYEHAKVASLLTTPDRTWLSEAKGTSIKVVAPLLAALKGQLPRSEFQVRTLFLSRPMDEILDSQSQMLKRLGKDQPTGDVSRAYVQQVRNAKTWLNRLQIPAIEVDYHQLVHDPELVLPQIAEFLGCEEKLDAMRAVIDPKLHRSRGAVAR